MIGHIRPVAVGPQSRTSCFALQTAIEVAVGKDDLVCKLLGFDDHSAVGINDARAADQPRTIVARLGNPSVKALGSAPLKGAHLSASDRDHACHGLQSLQGPRQLCIASLAQTIGDHSRCEEYDAALAPNSACDLSLSHDWPRASLAHRCTPVGAPDGILAGRYLPCSAIGLSPTERTLMSWRHRGLSASHVRTPRSEDKVT